MTALKLIMTAGGQTRFTAAQVAGEAHLAMSRVGFTDQAFVAAPSLTALPGQLVAIDTVAGAAIGDNIVHLTVRDDSAATYLVRGFGLFLADGTLFAVYAQAEPLVEKSAGAALLLAVDIAFPTDDITQLVFGATDFIYPPATSITAGVAALATQAEVDAGTDPRKIVTPATLDARLREVIDQHTGTVSEYVPLAQRGAAGGVATLGDDAKVPVAQLPAFIPAAQRGAASGVATLGGDGKVTPAQLAPSVSPAALAAALALLLPAGTISLWFGADAPAGWAICDGSIEQRADGSGLIATPDLRGRVPVGVSGDHPLGATFGQTISPLSIDPAGTGASVNVSIYGGYAGGGSQQAVAAGRNGAPPTLTDPGHAHTGTVDVTQPSIALTYIMKL